jgi:hypothetical protein
MYSSQTDLSDSEIKSLDVNSLEGFSIFIAEHARGNPFDIKYENAMAECFRGIHSTAKTNGASKITEWQQKALARIGIKVRNGTYTSGLIHLKLKYQRELDLVEFKLFIDSFAERLSPEQYEHFENIIDQIYALNNLMAQSMYNNCNEVIANGIDERDHLFCQIASMALTPDFIEHLKDPIAFMEIFGCKIGKYIFAYVQESPHARCDKNTQTI